VSLEERKSPIPGCTMGHTNHEQFDEEFLLRSDDQAPGKSFFLEGGFDSSRYLGLTKSGFVVEE
jgi:hypothetical protein